MKDAKVVNKLHKVKKSVEASLLATVSDAARLTRTIAKNSIKKRRNEDDHARPGQPVKTRFGLIKQSILYDVDKQRQDMIVGPIYSRVGMSANIHEMGGRFRGRVYAPRPFMWPAFQKIISRLPRMWRYSIR